MMKNNINDSRVTLDNSQIQLMRKESANSWYRSSYEDEGSMTPVSMNDECPLTMLDTKAKFRTVRNINPKSLLGKNDKTIDETNPVFEEKRPRAIHVSKKVQEMNDGEKCEEIDIQFKESDGSAAKLASNKYADDIENSDDGCIRMLHKMVSNTVKHYKIDDTYGADDIMMIYENNHMLAQYSKIATLDQDMRMLASIIDFGEKPIHFAMNPECTDILLDGVDLTEDGILMPKKKQNTTLIIETASGTSSQKGSTTDDKINKYKEMLSIPPRPTDKVDVITYGEGASNLQFEYNISTQDKVIDRELSILNLEETIEGANKILKPLKGKVATYDRLILLYLVFGLLIFGISGFLLGWFVHFSIAIVFGLAYFIILGVSVYLYKKRCKWLLVQSHFGLALYLHGENMRLYLKHRMRFRPGFMAKWIEIYYIPERIKK